MKRTKQTIINRRIMHRYQEKYRLWSRYNPHFPILRIRPSNFDWDVAEWLKYSRSSVLCFKPKGETIICKR